MNNITAKAIGLSTTLYFVVNNKISKDYPSYISLNKDDRITVYTKSGYELIPMKEEDKESFCKNSDIHVFLNEEDAETFLKMKRNNYSIKLSELTTKCEKCLKKYGERDVHMTVDTLYIMDGGETIIINNNNA